MVPDINENATKDRKIHGESNVWNTALSCREIYGFAVHVVFE